MTTTEAIPTLTTVDEAIALMTDLAAAHDWVSVFWDRGWGDSGQVTEISIIVDGNGQQPKAIITDDVYVRLLADGTIAENSLATFKARRCHDFRTPPEQEKAGPDPANVAEQVVRKLVADRPDLPLRAEFFCGLSRAYLPVAVYDVLTTPICGAGWFVRIIPGATDAAVSAAGAPDPFLGANVIGRAVNVDYPRAGDAVDLDALAGPEFAARLAEVVNERLAAIATARAEASA